MHDIEGPEKRPQKEWRKEPSLRISGIDKGISKNQKAPEIPTYLLKEKTQGRHTVIKQQPGRKDK